jgi:hypothetical protein
MEHEERREHCGEEEAENQRSSNSRPERYAHYLLNLSHLKTGYFADLTELDLPETMKTFFPDPTDLLNFTLTITPDEGALFATSHPG